MHSRYFRHPQNKHKNSNLDGMVVGGRTVGRGSQLGVTRRTAATRPQGRIDDFQRAPGRTVTNQFRQTTLPGSQTDTARVLRANAAASTPRAGRRNPGWRKALSKSALSLAVLTLLMGGFLLGKGYLKARQIFKGGAAGAAALQEGVDPNQLKGEGDGRVNILVLGKGGPGHDGADLTDTLLIASIDPIQKEASLLSVPRDLFVEVPDFGGMKVNSVYATVKQQAQANGQSAAQQETAGIDTIQKTLEEAMGIPIHYYAMVDFEAFRQAIDSVGGVSIDVQEQLYDPTVAWENNNNPLIADTGRQTFNGKKALLYARSRHGSERGDFDRSSRQREIILGLKDRVLSLGTFGNPLKISQLTDAFGNHAQTNLSINELTRLYELAQEIDSSRVASVGLADPPNDYVTTDFVAGQSVVVPRAGLYDFSEIQHYVRNSLRDSFLRKENAKVMIINGTTTPGLATQKAEELRSFGYNVTAVANAPTDNYKQTILVDLRAGANKYTQRYLEQRLQVLAVNNLPDAQIQAADADLVIIIGQ